MADHKPTPAWEGLEEVRSEPKPVFSFRFDRDLVARLDSHAKNVASTRNKQAERALTVYLNMYGAKDTRGR